MRSVDLLRELLYNKRLIRTLTFSYYALENDVDVNKIHLPELERLEGYGRLSILHHLAQNAPTLTLLNWNCNTNSDWGAAPGTQGIMYADLARWCPLLATLNVQFHGNAVPDDGAAVDLSPLQRWTRLSDFTTRRLLTSSDFFLSLSAARPPLKQLTLHTTVDSPMDAINVLIETTASTLGTHPRGGIGALCSRSVSAEQLVLAACNAETPTFSCHCPLLGRR